MATRMQQRRGTAAQWISTNGGAGPVLNAGEMGWESDTNKFKIGDGVNNWTSLDYFSDINSTIDPAFGSSITFEGSTANAFETTLTVTDPTADRTITIPDVTGTVITTGNLSDITNIGVFTSTITMEGSSADDFELTLSAGNPTADRTITFPDATGTVALTSDITAGISASSTDTLTNKSISLGSNTVTSTLAQLNTAISDADVASLAGTETLTNKTLTTPVISSITNGAATLTLPTSTGTVALTSDIAVTASSTTTFTNKTLTSPKINEDVAVTATATELNYVDGVTSAIQTQLDDKSTASKTETFTNKSISLGSNTVTSTLAQLNTAISDADVASLAGSETLTNKTLTSPVVSGLTLSDASIVIEGATANDFETTLTVTDPTADRTVTFPDATGTVALTNNKLDAFAATTSAELRTVISDETGTGGLVFADTPTLVTPNIGAATGTSLVLSGDLTVNGTTTTINSTTLAVDDKNITLGDVATPSDATADGGGITLKGATDKTFNWVDTTDAWTSSEHINLASGKAIYLNGTLETAVAQTLTNKTIALGSNTVSGTLAEFNTAVTDANFASLEGSETLTNKTLGSAVATTALTLNATAELRLADTDSSHYVGFKAPGTVSANKVWVLPAADGTSGQVLSTDGSGTLSFASAGGISASSTDTLTNKSVSLTTNTLTGTLAEFNTALSGADFATLAGTETFTNKTLTSPKINEDVAITATATELNYVDGVTSAIQTQLDTKAGFTSGINTVSGTTYTLVANDHKETVLCTSSSAVTVTIPPESSVAWPAGSVVTIVQNGTAQVTVAAGAGVTLNTQGGSGARKTRYQHQMASLFKTGTNTWMITGDLVAP